MGDGDSSAVGQGGDCTTVPGRGRRRLALAVLTVVAVALLAAGVAPATIPQVFSQQDKLHHVAGFFAFGWALRVAFPRLGIGALLAAGVTLALLVEAAQCVLPLRTASPWDLLAGVVGVALACRLRMKAGTRGAAAPTGSPRPSDQAGEA